MAARLLLIVLALGVAPATAALVADPFVVRFEPQTVFTTSAPKSVTFTNEGSTAVTVERVDTDGEAIVLSHDCATLAPGEACTVLVASRPTRDDDGFIDTVGLTTSAGYFFAFTFPNGVRSFVPHFYGAILGRKPDTAGAAYWMAQEDAFNTFDVDRREVDYAMAMTFLSSDEYTARQPSDATFVSDLYRAFLDRPADASGLGYWTSQLSQGMPRGIVLVSFLLSTEFQLFARKVHGANPFPATNAAVLIDFYRGLLHRLPDRDGFEAWKARLLPAFCPRVPATHAMVQSISAAFLEGDEYAARRTSNADFVSGLYNAFLRRGGDLEGVRYWIDELDSGRDTRDGLRSRFIATAEYADRLAWLASQGCPFF